MNTVDDDHPSDDNDTTVSPDYASGGMKAKLLEAFPPFAGRNFRLYFVGQIISMIGTWLEIVARGGWCSI